MEHAIIVAASVIAAALAIGLSAFGAAMGDGQVTAKAIEGIARQPEAKGSIMTTMFISVGLIESIPIIAAVIAIVLVFANPFIK
ncbi:MAG TPA: F0F1 ATP synthase subunit C [Sporomusaceae bacterium]|jgi:F-type H+-transporting ATPase subunit c|uniref:ATP synthase subunit c n=1 Tax=Anaerospora hongkongensis TaxID=244830 RepID=A0A4V2Q7S0_9FIRM|nr:MULTISPECIES: F0F1 ATP synthase subunit C [Anaerospora]TCL32995.1 ATP synthase F0 subcomplex C subunit [Anaerospora hongkongensis]HAK73602.1 F0F1 ATP synthase subunit C [Sporomusaceae bacterium]